MKIGQEIGVSDYRKYCAHCGQPVPGGASFCPSCGKNPDSAGPPPTAKRNLLPVICLAVAALCMCITLIVALRPPQTAAQAPITVQLPAPVYTVAPAVTTPPSAVESREPQQAWGAWSQWNTRIVTGSSSRQVETRQVVLGYNLVHYGTQQAAAPHYRMFRDYSINKNFTQYNARKSYGEKHLTSYASASQMKYATAFPPDGSFVELSLNGEIYSGYQMGTSTAYNFGDDMIIWFIESAVTQTEYRYRDAL